MNTKQTIVVIVTAILVTIGVAALVWSGRQRPETIDVVQNNRAEDNSRGTQSHALFNNGQSGLDGVKAPDCSTWQDKQYTGESTLFPEPQDQQTIDVNGFKKYSDGRSSFYYPEAWRIQTFENEDGLYRFLTETNGSLDLHTNDDKSEFVDMYNRCLARCFNDLPWDAAGCSEDFSNTDLEKFLNGGYIYFIQTAGLPPNGSGSYSFKKMVSGNIVRVSYSSEELIGQNHSEFKEKALKIIESYKDESKNTFSNIDKSNWKTYRNDEHGFEVEYPVFFTTNVNGVSFSDDEFRIGVSIIESKTTIEGPGSQVYPTLYSSSYITKGEVIGVLEYKCFNLDGVALVQRFFSEKKDRSISASMSYFRKEWQDIEWQRSHNITRREDFVPYCEEAMMLIRNGMEKDPTLLRYQEIFEEIIDSVKEIES